MRNDRIDWPNPDNTAWPATVWPTLDALVGTATYSQQGHAGRIATSATANMQARVISSTQVQHQDLEWRGPFQFSQVGHAHDWFFRADGAWGGTTAWLPNSGYAFEFDTSGNAYNAYKVTGNVGAAITGAPAATAFTYSANTLYNILLKLKGYFCGMKIWAAGTNEPGGWGWSAIDPDASIAATTVGRVQFSTYQVPVTATNIDIGSAVLVNNLAQQPRFRMSELLMDESAGAPVFGRRPTFRRF